MTTFKELIKEVQKALKENEIVELNLDDSRKVVDLVFGIISDAQSEGEVVDVTGYGKFGTTTRAARKGRNPQSGEEIQIAESTTPNFKASSTLKKKIKGI